MLVFGKEQLPIGFGKAIVRNLAQILSIIPFGLGFLWAGFSKGKNGGHDVIAKTYVIQKADDMGPPEINPDNPEEEPIPKDY